jgi:hypothetical protein
LLCGRLGRRADALQILCSAFFSNKTDSTLVVLAKGCLGVALGIPGQETNLSGECREPREARPSEMPVRKWKEQLLHL